MAGGDNEGTLLIDKTGGKSSAKQRYVPDDAGGHIECDVYSHGGIQHRLPKGFMFNLPTIGHDPATDTDFDYNFAGTGANYPTTGVQVHPRGRTVAGLSGVYIAPREGVVIYIDNIVITFNHNAKSLFGENYKEVGDVASGIVFNHSGRLVCDRNTPHALSLVATSTPQEVTDAFAANEYYYTFLYKLAVPARLDGDNGDYIGLHTRGDTAIYLGTGLGANKLTKMHFAFNGWTVEKTVVNGEWHELVAKS